MKLESDLSKLYPTPTYMPESETISSSSIIIGVSIIGSTGAMSPPANVNVLVAKIVANESVNFFICIL